LRGASCGFCVPAIAIDPITLYTLGDIDEA
jgi:hypothetical protein